MNTAAFAVSSSLESILTGPLSREHINWTVEDWKKVIWTDETWVNSTRHRRQFVTRQDGEALDETCIFECPSYRSGWMFWGSISGEGGKGPGVFWEKAWGTIRSTSYLEHIIPVIQSHVATIPNAILMQDNASSHASRVTQEALHTMGIQVLSWPANSPDLNPIENIWCKMKDHIQRYHNDDIKPTYDRLKSYVSEAWEAIPESLVIELVSTMPQRVSDVLITKGGHTNW